MKKRGGRGGGKAGQGRMAARKRRREGKGAILAPTVISKSQRLSPGVAARRLSVFYCLLHIMN